MYDHLFNIATVLLRQTDEEILQKVGGILDPIRQARWYYEALAVQRTHLCKHDQTNSFYHELKRFIVHWNDAPKTTWEDVKYVIEQAETIHETH